MLGNPSQHLWANFVLVMKCKNEVRPSPVEKGIWGNQIRV